MLHTERSCMMQQNHVWPRAASLEKTLVPGKDWRQEDEGETEDETVGWHHQLDGHEFEQTPGNGNGQEAWCAAVHGVAELDNNGI